MSNNLVEQIVSEVIRKQTSSSESPQVASSYQSGCGLTEYVGTAIGNTIGLVIANVDNQLHELMGIDKKYRSLGIIGARTGAGPQIFAADEAIKATNSEILKIELPRDTMGGGGHGSLILFGAQDVSDARRAVEVSLNEVHRTMGDVYSTPAGHLEFQYTARASYALNKAFGAPIGKSFGMTVGCPAAIGVVIADVAAKSAVVEGVGYSSPTNGTSYSNEVIFTFSGDSGAVRQAVIAAREVGFELLATLDPAAIKSTTTPYI